MTAADPEDPRLHRALAGATRVRVLQELRAGTGPLAIVDVAARLGLHPNTARLHLDHLVDARLATRMNERRGGRGRPRLVYAPVPQRTPAESADGGYRLLAEILAGHLERTAASPTDEAAAAGRAWGQVLADRLADRAADTRPPTPDRSVGELVELLDQLGFAPRPVATDTVELHHCPLGQVPEQYSPVVCGVHLGLMQGALAERGASVRATGLEPFARPHVCVARLEGVVTGGAPVVVADG